MAVFEATTRADEFIFQVLSADATLGALVGSRIYVDVEPQENTAYPVCIWQLQSGGRDTRPAGPGFVYANLLYLVKAIDKSESYPWAVMDRVTALLDNARGTTPSGGEVIYCQRQQPWRMTEIDQGVTYKHVGALFSIRCR